MTMQPPEPRPPAEPPPPEATPPTEASPTRVVVWPDRSHFSEFDAAIEAQLARPTDDPRAPPAAPEDRPQSEHPAPS